MALLQKAYLGATPLFRNTAWFQDDAPQVVAISSVVSLTAGSPAHTNGSWSELVSSTSADVDYLIVQVRAVASGGSNTATLLSIGTGVASSETPIAENIAIGSATNSTSENVTFGVAVSISSGTRIAAQIRAARGSSQTASVQVTAYNFGGAALLPSAVDVLGTSTANSRGTNLAASNAWTEIVGSTAQDYIGLAFVPSAGNAAINNQNGSYELGVGASGSEEVVGFFRFTSTTSETIANRGSNQNTHIGNGSQSFWIFGKDVPAGSRIAMRQSTADSTFDGCIIAIPKP
jgi:hypothetical protein